MRRPLCSHKGVVNILLDWDHRPGVIPRSLIGARRKRIRTLVHPCTFLHLLGIEIGLINIGPLFFCLELLEIWKVLEAEALLTLLVEVDLDFEAEAGLVIVVILYIAHLNYYSVCR
jgi:hypothetical protein